MRSSLLPINVVTETNMLSAVFIPRIYGTRRQLFRIRHGKSLSMWNPCGMAQEQTGQSTKAM